MAKTSNIAWTDAAFDYGFLYEKFRQSGQPP